MRKLNPSGKSPILCFVGPPGVGKTSLGQSIAKATARKFVRVSLGGVHDEAEIRGHRRTYIGSLPGNIIQSLRKAGTRNCVLMLDEVDKLGAGGFHGDPASALLEVLDPEQNSTFRDNYLGVPFDLSGVMFICTGERPRHHTGAVARPDGSHPAAGLYRAGKLQIARRYLVARQLAATGLKPEQCEISDEALSAIIDDYTREAGVRNLEREIGRVFRSVAVRIAEGSAQQVKIEPVDLPCDPRSAHIRGRGRDAQARCPVSRPAWRGHRSAATSCSSKRRACPAAGKLILTGQLGEVMKESAQAALSLVKARAERLGVAPELIEKSDIHVHVPAGATPKDGPSAGVAMFVALVSLLTDRPVRTDVAMTGEISLRGLVLPIGGVKEKVLAALRAGIRTVMLPSRNRRDLEEIPPEARAQLAFVWLGRSRRCDCGGAGAGSAASRSRPDPDLGLHPSSPGSRQQRGTAQQAQDAKDDEAGPVAVGDSRQQRKSGGPDTTPAKVMKPEAPVIAPACPGGACLATWDNWTPFHPIAVAPKSAATASRAACGQAALKFAAANAQTPVADADEAEHAARRNPMVGDRTPGDPAGDAADIRRRQRQPRSDQRISQCFGQIDDQKTHQAHLHRRVDVTDDRKLGQPAILQHNAQRRHQPRKRKWTVGADDVEPSSRWLRESGDDHAAGGDPQQRGTPTDRQRQCRQHGAGQRSAAGHAGLLDRERERQAVGASGACEQVRMTPA